MPLNIQPPTKQELTHVKKFMDRDPRKKVRQRLKILQLAWKGVIPTQIQLKLDCSKDTVYRCLHTWNQEGLGAILTWRQTTSYQKQVKRRTMLHHLVQHSPTSLQLHFNSWSLQTISIFLKSQGICDISPTTIWRDFKLLNISYSQTRDQFTFKPPDYEVKRAQLDVLRRYLPSTTRLVYLDEKGPVHALRYGGRSWSTKPQTRDYRQKSYGKVTFLGAFDPLDYELAMYPMETNNSTFFRHQLQLVKMDFLGDGYTKLLLVMDNAPWHRSKETLEHLTDEPQVEYFFLPTYSPELNPIERCFGSYTRECLNHGRFISKKQLIERTYDYCHYFNTVRREIYSKEVAPA